jgi:short-subunit dehydrogenase
MPNAIIIGASSGIGKALAQQMAGDGYTVYVTGRRIALLQELQAEYPDRIRVSAFDVRDLDVAAQAFESMCNDLGSVDVVVVNAGWGDVNKRLDWQVELDVIDTNVTAAAHLCVRAMHIFYTQKHGHLVGISSIAGLIGGRLNPAYNASKAFLSNFLAGLRLAVSARKLDIAITDIRPGFIKTDLVKSERVFWMQPLDKGARQIYAAIKAKRKVAYITKRWGLIALLMKIRGRW